MKRESRVADGGTEESLVSCPTKNKTRRDERLSGLPIIPFFVNAKRTTQDFVKLNRRGRKGSVVGINYQQINADKIATDGQNDRY
jgi:hypothetical protein